METKDCCETKEKSWSTKEYLIAGAVALVLLFTIVQYFQMNSIKDKLTGSTVNSGIDMTGWTENEKMNYEHHGTLPARLQQKQQSQLPTMVGGC